MLNDERLYAITEELEGYDVIDCMKQAIAEAERETIERCLAACNSAAQENGVQYYQKNAISGEVYVSRLEGIVECEEAIRALKGKL